MMEEPRSCQQNPDESNLAGLRAPVNKEQKPKQQLNVKELLLAFLMPTIFGKLMVLYFGLNYSQYPDRGYGIGLALSIAFTVTMFARFIWRYRDYEE